MQALHLTVSNHHDWLDYLAAFAGAIGGIAAVVALIVAVQSRKAADATQQLADEQVAIIRREAEAAEVERGRRAAPEIRLHASGIGTSDDAPPRLIVLTVAFSNENGTRPVERLSVNLLVPDHMALRTCSDSTGNGDGTAGIRQMAGLELSDGSDAVLWSPETVGPLEQREYELRFLKLQPIAGNHRIEAKLVHGDLPGGISRHAWILKVPERGDQVDLEPVSVASA